MKIHHTVALLFCLALPAAAFSAETSPRERISLDAGWRFTKGDPAAAAGELNDVSIKEWTKVTGAEFVENPAAMVATNGSPSDDIAYAQSDFNDSDWRLLNLPHDWGIEGPFKMEYPGSTGKLPWWGVGWYRQHLVLPATDTGRRIYLDVDGAMAYSMVWINGHFVGGWPYGYASWRVDLTPYVKFGAENVIAIRLDNPPDSSRWYPGGGIYRNVWLVKTSPVHVAHWGTYVTTPAISPAAATVRIQVKLANDTDANATVSLQNEIYELNTAGVKSGQAVATGEPVELPVPAHQTQMSDTQVSLPSPKLWNLEKPNRYVAVTSVSQNGRLMDRYETPFGIRTIEFTATNGFLLNGRRVPLNGVCDHHDLGALGAALNVRALERQLQELKGMGVNALRTSHNPPAPELLDLCDRLGILVMDESFDCWEKGKTKNDYHLIFDEWHESDWRAELRRDRNHPSIILWSIGNEIPEQQDPRGLEIAAELTRIAHAEDPTRPTTSACNRIEAGYNGFQNDVDVFGYNYHPTEYARFRAAHPGQPLFGSETASCISSRGVYLFPVSTNQAGGLGDSQMSSYDLYAPKWATPPDREFKGQDENPSVCGEFVWTGFDYLGEPTPFKGVSRSSYFGIIDLAGFPKDRYYLYQARWRPELPMAHLVPQCWNWPAGQVTPVHVYTSGDEAELFLNGQSLGRRKKGPFEYRLVWDQVVYQPGVLKVVAYKNGKKWATDTVTTAGPSARLVLSPDRKIIYADGKDLSFVTVKVVDKKGIMAPLAANPVHFSISGPGEIVATDNGDATDLNIFSSPDRKAFNGLALCIVRAKPGPPGIIKLTASSNGLTGATVTLFSR